MRKIKKWGVALFSAVVGLFSGMTGCETDVNDLYMGPGSGLSGKVFDADTDEPITGIRVDLLKDGSEIGSDETYTNGSFSIIFNSGDYSIKEGRIKIRLSDVDGSSNGAYHGQTNFVEYNYTNNRDFEFKLTNKQ